MPFEVGDIIGNHVICLKALVGSHNYNLNTPSSDKDYKYFVYPTWDDLYDGKKYHKEVVTETEDYTVHDIRQLPMLIWKANLPPSSYHQCFMYSFMSMEVLRKVVPLNFMIWFL